MSAAEFVSSMFYEESLYNTPLPMTTEDAALNLHEWRAEGDIDIPDGLTPRRYARLWNLLCARPEEVSPCAIG